MLQRIHRFSRFSRLLHLFSVRSRYELGLNLHQHSMVSQMVVSSPAHGDAGTIPSRQPSSTIEPGKTFDSINMEELMTNIWNAEDSKVGVGNLASSSAEHNGVNRQNSFSLPSALSNKMVEDVWREIQKQSSTDVAEKQQPDQHHQRHQQQREAQHQYSHQGQTPMGEMTLEDFLVRTGVVRDDPDAGSHTAESSNFYSSVSTPSITNGFSSSMEVLTPSLQHDWMNYRPRSQHQQMLQHAEALAAAKRGFQPPVLMLPTGSSMCDGLADNAVLGSDGFASSLALSPSFSDYSLHSRKRFSSEVAVEKTMERRQKRMIKNRESAARSRARKQAYTVELEAEITMLKEENARLKQQQHNLPEVQTSSMPVLRRTQSF